MNRLAREKAITLDGPLSVALTALQGGFKTVSVNKVFIVGVRHSWQQLFGYSIGRPSVEDPKTGALREITETEFASFDQFLRDAIRQNSIKTILEEACFGGPHQRMAKLSEELNICHTYCELPQKEREERGIKTRDEREAYWLSVLKNVGAYPAMIICGATHVDSFSNLLRESEYEPLLIVGDYEKTLVAP